METFNRMLAVLETDAHLEVLAAQGRVRRTADADTDVNHHAPPDGHRPGHVPGAVVAARCPGAALRWMVVPAQRRRTARWRRPA